MRYDPDRHHRRSIRLRGYDYSLTGTYFLTICTKDQQCLFGGIDNGIMHLNEIGNAVEHCWLAIPEHFPHVELDEYVIMPNHVHGIILIGDNPTSADVNNHSPAVSGVVSPVGSPVLSQATPPATTTTGQNDYSALQFCLRSPSKTIGSIVRGFKIGVTKWSRQNGGQYDVWQPNYYDHIIRDEDSLNRVRQ